MALKKTLNTAFDVEVIDAYHRVEQVVLLSKESFAFRLRSYKNAESKIAFADVGFEAAYDIDGKNPIAQAYEHLKSLEEFKDFVDC